jgi:hypothetical protein
MHYTMCHVLCHDCQTTVRRYLGLDNPTSWDVTSGAGGGAQEDAKAFLCALEMVAAALQYISRSGPLRERNMTIGLTL